MADIEKLNIVIADDHTLFRKGLITLLTDFNFVEKYSEVSTGSGLIDLLGEADFLPDLVLLDTNFQDMNGVEVLKKIRELYPQLKIIVLSTNEEDQFILNMIENGVNGYLLKNCEPDELEKAIRMVTEKEYYFNYKTSELIRNAYLHMTDTGHNKNFNRQFTPRETEVLHLVCKEFTTQEIARKLKVSPRTIETHRKNMIEKAGVKNLAGLILFAIKHKLVEI